MTPQGTITPRTASDARRMAVTYGSMLVLLVTAGLMLFAAMRTPLKDDIAWLLYVARRWMAGRELYVDLVEVNPPLIVWLSAIPISDHSWAASRFQAR